MAYVYRYIDLTKREVCYIGKVSGRKADGYDPLENRHKQHTYEEWYKKIGEKNIIMQYLEIETPADADIIETWLISKYANTGQLYNKGKATWGESRIKLDFIGISESQEWEIFGWSLSKGFALQEAFNTFLFSADRYSVDTALSGFSKKVKEICANFEKIEEFEKGNTQCSFLRIGEREAQNNAEMKYKTNFCPRCGARMDGGAYNAE